MASKQLSELDNVSVPLKDSDYLLVSQFNAAQHVNQSKKAKVSDFANKMVDKFQTKLDTMKIQIENSFDERYAKKDDVYTAAQVEARLDAVKPEGYLTIEEATAEYVSKTQFNESTSQLRTDIEKKLNATDAENDYAKLSAVYSKQEIDSKFVEASAASDAAYAKSSSVYTKTQIDQLSNVYAKIDETYSKDSMDNVLDALSNDLANRISQSSPLSVKEFGLNAQDIAALNGIINYVKMTNANQTTIQLPQFEEDVVRNFYVVVDNSSKYASTKLTFNAGSDTKVFADNEDVFNDVPANQIATLQFIDVAKNGILKAIRENLQSIDMSGVIANKITLYLVITEDGETKSIDSKQVNEHSQYVLQPMQRDYMTLNLVTIKHGEEATIQVFPDENGNYIIADVGADTATITMSYSASDLHYIKFYDTFDGKKLLYPTYKVYKHQLYVSNDGISYSAYVDPTEIQLKFPEVDHPPYKKDWSYDITQYTTTTILDIADDIEVLATFSLDEAHYDIDVVYNEEGQLIEDPEHNVALAQAVVDNEIAAITIDGSSDTTYLNLGVDSTQQES